MLACPVMLWFSLISIWFAGVCAIMVSAVNLAFLGENAGWVCSKMSSQKVFCSPLQLFADKPYFVLTRHDETSHANSTLLFWLLLSVCLLILRRAEWGLRLTIGCQGRYCFLPVGSMKDVCVLFFFFSFFFNIKISIGCLSVRLFFWREPGQSGVLLWRRM